MLLIEEEDTFGTTARPYIAKECPGAPGITARHMRTALPSIPVPKLGSWPLTHNQLAK